MQAANFCNLTKLQQQSMTLAALGVGFQLRVVHDVKFRLHLERDGLCWKLFKLLDCDIYGLMKNRRRRFGMGHKHQSQK